MKKTLILKKNYEFKSILTKGKYYGGKYIEMFILKNNNPINMLGIAIGKKIANSVIRHKIKRLIKENYRLIEKDLEVGNSLVILWNKKVPKEKARFLSIKEDMINIFKKAKML